MEQNSVRYSVRTIWTTSKYAQIILKFVWIKCVQISIRIKTDLNWCQTKIWSDAHCMASIPHEIFLLEIKKKKKFQLKLNETYFWKKKNDTNLKVALHRTIVTIFGPDLQSNHKKFQNPLTHTISKWCGVTLFLIFGVVSRVAFMAA